MNPFRKANKYSQLIICIFIFVSLGAYAGKENCDSSAQSRNYQLAEAKTPGMDEIFKLLFEGQKNKFRSQLKDLTKSSAFNNFLQEKDLGLDHFFALDINQRTELIETYINDYLSKYRFEDLIEPQRIVALENMYQLHGAKQRSGNIRDNIQSLSKDNLRRITQNKIYQSKADMKEAEELLEQLELSISHNSHIMDKKPQFPLLSPSEIEKMGLPRFAANSNEFNRLIGSTDFVYFFVKLGLKSKSNSNNSEYGGNGVLVNREYAIKNAWISPFIMYHHNIYAAIKQTTPNKAKNFLDRFAQKNPEGKPLWVLSYGEFKGQQEILEALSSVHLLDFTFLDFEFLIKNQILLSLQKIKKKNKKLYKQHLKNLRNSHELQANNHRSFNKTVIQLAFEPLNISSHYEARIPIAVPESELISF